MSIESVKRALKAFTEGKSVNEYNLPSSVKREISNKKLTSQEINSFYKKSIDNNNNKV